MWSGLILLSVLAVVVLNFAGALIPGQAFDGTGSYMIMGVIVCAVMRWLRTSTMSYWAKPVFGWKFVVAAVLMGNLIVVQLQDQDFSGLSVATWIRGVIFLITVATAEEILSRGIAFGVLQRLGLFTAVLGSSLLFGVMHINPYLGNFDPWQAYWHIVSAFSFGVFACALMVLTRSIWMPIIVHTFSNAGLLVQDAPTKADEAFRVSTPFLAGLFHPLPVLATFVIPALILFWLARDMPLHPRLQPLARRWKLIESESK
jgi:membrane protease YdiL (CAAX protease family)